jgi:mercuric ion transport protein
MTPNTISDKSPSMTRIATPRMAPTAAQSTTPGVRAAAPALTPERRARRAALLNYLSLFSSFSTLLCCALPSALVLLGMGTAVASLLSAAPWLVSLSRHKIWTFTIAGTLIAASFAVTYLVAPRLREGQQCTAGDPTTCGEVSKLSRILLWGSALVWTAGFFVAYLLGLILQHMDR